MTRTTPRPGIRGDGSLNPGLDAATVRAAIKAAGFVRLTEPPRNESESFYRLTGTMTSDGIAVTTPVDLLPVSSDTWEGMSNVGLAQLRELNAAEFWALVVGDAGWTGSGTTADVVEWVGDGGLEGGLPVLTAVEVPATAGQFAFDETAGEWWKNSGTDETPDWGIDLPDLSDYATTSYVDDSIEAIPPPDLSPYATASALATVSNLVANKQPLDSNLTAIAALDTTEPGRELLTESESPVGTGSLVRASTLADYISSSSVINGGFAISFPEEIVARELDGKLWADRLLYSSSNDATSTYVRNTSCYVTKDLTSRAVWQAVSGQQYQPIAISPRHVIVAWHAKGFSENQVCRWVTNANAVVTRTVGTVTRIGTTDIGIAALDADLPATIKPSKVLPANWDEKINASGLIVFAQNPQEIFTRQITSVNGASAIHAAASDLPFSTFTKAVVSGDSGSPVQMLIGDDLVLLGTHFAATSFPWIASYITEINAAMTSLGGGYQLEEKVI